MSPNPDKLKDVGFLCRRCGITVFASPERGVAMANYCNSCGAQAKAEHAARRQERIDRKPLMPRIIRTVQWTNRNPLRQFDWCATAEDYEPGDPIGTGPTHEAAVDDLAEQYIEIEERTK